MYNSMKDAFQQGYKERSQLYKERLAQWNKEPSVFKVERPTNIARARDRIQGKARHSHSKGSCWKGKEQKARKAPAQEAYKDRKILLIQQIPSGCRRGTRCEKVYKL